MLMFNYPISIFLHGNCIKQNICYVLWGACIKNRGLGVSSRFSLAWKGQWKWFEALKAEKKGGFFMKGWANPV